MYTSPLRVTDYWIFILIPHDLAISNFVYFTNSFPLFLDDFQRNCFALKKEKLSWKFTKHERVSAGWNKYDKVFADKLLQMGLLLK